MAKIQTCPHCGAGNSHQDSHCWRCGEALPTPSEGKAIAPGIRDISKSGPEAAARVMPAVRDVTGAYGGKEQELRDKEKELKAQMEALATQHHKAEKLSWKLDEEKKALEILKASLSAQEDELYTRAALLRHALKAADGQNDGGPLGDPGADLLADVDPEAVLALEKERIRKEVEQEMAGQLDRITQLEESLSAQEDDLYTKAAILKHALQASTGQPSKDGVPDGAEALRRLADIDPEPVIALERARIRQQIEREMADQLGRVARLEAGLRAAYEQAKEGSSSSPAAPADIDETIRAVTEALRAQLGAGGPAAEPKKLSTGIASLDRVLAGGLPAGAVVLVNGPAGSMKSSLAYSILYANAAGGTKGMYLSLEQDRGSLLRQTAALGMDQARYPDDLAVADVVELRRETEGLPGDWRGILVKLVGDEMRKAPFPLLVLDSLESFLALDPRWPPRAEVQDLFDSFRSMGLTTLVVSEAPFEKLEGMERTELCAADGALELMMSEEGGRVRRRVRCLKMRGADIDTRCYDLAPAEGTFTLTEPEAGPASVAQEAPGPTNS